MLPRIEQPCLALLFALTGALSFWLPDVAVHIFAGRNFDSPHVRIVTFLLPATFLAACFVAQRFAVKHGFTWAGAAMLLGVWLTGGFFMTLAATAGGDGFAGSDGVRGGLLMTVLGALPPVTFMFAAYDGSLLALLAVTAGVPLLWGIQESGIPLLFHRRHK